MIQESKAPIYQDEIVIGKIAKSFGVKGYLKVISLTDFPERYKELHDVHLYSEKTGRFYTNPEGGYEIAIEDTEILTEFIKVKLKGVNDKDAADKLRDYLITLPIEDRILRDDGEHYYYEIIGYEIWDGDDKLGVLNAIEDFGGGDLLRVVLDEPQKEVYIPYRDEFIDRIDKDSRKIYVKLIDGLIET